MLIGKIKMRFFYSQLFFLSIKKHEKWEVREC